MSVLTLRLAGPMQSWGDASRFTRRETRRFPSKSGVIGLLAAAQGRSREDPVDDLAALKFGVREDQRGTLMRDFHTASKIKANGDRESMPLSHRFYLADAVFVAALEGDRDLISGLDEAVRHPVFPLFLGRRSCVPAGRVSLGASEGTVESALGSTPWQASLRTQRHQPATVQLAVVMDAAALVPGRNYSRDVPVSFSPSYRDYNWRQAVESVIDMPNPSSSAAAHDPFSALGRS